MTLLLSWIKQNLLASKIDILLTIVGCYFIYFICSLFFTLRLGLWIKAKNSDFLHINAVNTILDFYN